MDERQSRVDHFNDGAGGHADEASYETSRRETVRRLHGAKESSALFGRSPTAVQPFPGAGRSKHEPLYDRQAVGAELSRPEARTVDIDPRILSGTQPGITHAGVEHYLGDEYEKTGQLHADHHNVGNQFPFVVTQPTNSPHPGMPTHQHVIISGHHRATAALLQGRKLTTRWIEQG